MTDTSPRLSLSYIAPQQAQKHVSMNETVRLLDALVQLTLVSRTIGAEPAGPAEGDAYVLPSGKTGAAWAGLNDNSVAAFYDGAWVELTPIAGWRGYVKDESALVAFDGSAWAGIGGGSSSSAPLFGVNATADATNRLTVKSDVELLTHDDVTPGTGDARKIINRASSNDAASVVFQTGFSGQAEFGLIGDDQFRLKVSDDGASFTDALIIDPVTADVGIGAAPKAKLYVKGDNLTSSQIGDVHIEKEGYASIFFMDTYAGPDSWKSSYIVQRRAHGTVAAPTAPANGDLVGAFAFRAWSPSGAWKEAAQFRSLIDATPSGSSTPMALAFLTGTSSASERMRIASNGNVGIGVTAPATTLDVNGPVKCKSYTVAGKPSASSSGAGAMIFISNETGGATLAFSDGSSWRRVADRAVVS